MKKIILVILPFLIINSVWTQNSLTVTDSSRVDSISTSDVTQSLEAIEDGHSIQTKMALIHLKPLNQWTVTDKSLDSLLRGEINQHGLVSLIDPKKTSSMLPSDSMICLLDSCLKAFADSLALSHLLLWEITHETLIRNFEITLIHVMTGQELRSRRFRIPRNKHKTDLLIRKAIWDVLGMQAPAELIVELDNSNWTKYFTAGSGRYYFGGAATIALTWIILQQDDNQPSPKGIGSPPDWPQQ